MADVTQILNAIEEGDPQAAEKLLPLVYEELRKLARIKMAQESPDHTLQATALVHEAYIRLVGPNNGNNWDNRGHFFAAAAEAMRRILVESARRRQTEKRGGEIQKYQIDASEVTAGTNSPDLVALDDALQKLAQVDSISAKLVELRFFAGLTNEEAAKVLDVSPRSTNRIWRFARSWLRKWLDKK